MSSQDDTTSYIQVHVETESGQYNIKCALSRAINGYSQYAEAAYKNGLLQHEGWFTVIDLDGYFYAYPLSQIHQIVCKQVDIE